MMPAMTVVNCLIIATDPTGDACDGCGDVPYLAAEEIIVEETGERVAYLCASCVQMLRDEAEEIE